MAVAERPLEPLHIRLGVTDEELAAIRDRLGGREPNDLELAMFSVMWSEHCSYKSSKPLLATLPDGGRGSRRRAWRERRRHLDRGRTGGRVQDRIAQPPVGGRALPGCGDRGRRDPARHLHDGRPADRRPRCAPLRRPGRAADAAPRRRRGARRRRLRQLRRRPDRRRRAGLRPELPGQPAGQRHGHRGPRGTAADPGRRPRPGQPGRALWLGDRARRDRWRLRPRQRHVHRRRSVQAPDVSRSATRSRRSC